MRLPISFSILNGFDIKLFSTENDREKNEAACLEVIIGTAILKFN